MGSLQTPEQTTAWELRTAWATSRPVVLVLADRCVVQRIEGTVEAVAVTGAFVIVAGWHVPTVDILAVRSPHFSQLGMAA